MPVFKIGTATLSSNSVLHLPRTNTDIQHPTYSVQVARKVIHRLYKLSPLHCRNAMTRRLGKPIVTTYVTTMVTYVLLVWSYMAKIRKRELQSLMNRVFRWSVKPNFAQLLTSPTPRRIAIQTAVSCIVLPLEHCYIIAVPGLHPYCCLLYTSRCV